MNLKKVLKRPVLTEKTTRALEAGNQYVFEVATDANKILIRKAVEELFDVRVLKVNIRNRKGKLKRVGRSIGYSKGHKQALVTLHPSDKIDVY